jgi:hypothetical protein
MNRAGMVNFVAMKTIYKVDRRDLVSRGMGVLVLLAGLLLAAGLCTASPHSNPVPSNIRRAKLLHAMPRLIWCCPTAAPTLRTTSCRSNTTPRECRCLQVQ